MVTGINIYNKKHLFGSILVGVLFLCFSLQIVAQTKPAFSEKVYLADSYYEEDGLASNMVFRMGQSTDNLMWFVTQKGVSIFDGLRWQTLGYDISTSLHANVSLISLTGGDILLSSLSAQEFKIVLFQNKEAISIPSPPGFKLTDDRLLYGQLGGTEYLPNRYYISLVNDEKLYLYNSAQKTWATFTIPKELIWHKVGSIHFFENQILFLSQSGLASFDLAKKQFRFDFIKELSGKPILNAITSPDQKTIYFLGTNFLGQFKNGVYTTLIDEIYPAGMPYLRYHNIIADKHKRIFFNYNGDIFKYDLRAHKLEQFKLDNANTESVPTDIFEDHEGNIWFSTLRGVKKVNSFRFYTIQQSYQSITSTEVSTLLTIDSSSMLMGGNSGLGIFQDNKVINVALPASASTHFTRVLDATKSTAGTIYLAANVLGVGVLSPPDNIRWYSAPKQELVTSITHHKGQIIAGTSNGTLYYFNNGRYIPFWNDELLYIRKLISLQDSLAILSNRGLYLMSDTDTLTIAGENPQAQNLYSYLKAGNRHFLGSLDGLCEIKGGKIIKVAEDSLRIDRPVYAMLHDSRDRLWMGTDKGIYIAAHNGKLINYNLQDGLVGKEINRSALELLPDGDIWIGTDQGVSVYNSEDDIEKKVIPKINIIGLSTIEKGKIDSNTDQTLSSDNNNLEFFFQTISFYRPRENQFRYKLEGLDEDWIYSDNHLINQVRYTNLPAGDYRFVIQARNGNNPWSPETYSRSITILQPFYKSWWFILITLAALTSLGYMMHALISNRQNEKRLRKAIEEKKAEIEESEKRFRAVWNGTDTGFVLINKLGEMLMANPSFCRLLNVEPVAILGKQIGTLLTEPDFTEEKLKEICQSKKVYRNYIVLNRNHQVCYLLVTITFVDHLLQDETLMIVGCKDVTEQKVAEANNIRLNEELIRQNMALLKKEDELANYNHELLQQREELENALRAVEERNFELDQFVYKTSHDLRAPVASALGLLNVIKMDKDYNRWPEYLNLIGTSLQKQDNFIRAMLNFSKSTRSKNKAESIDFKEMIEQCFQELQYLPNFNEVEKVVQISPEGATYYSDKIKLYIILANIISNSIKYRDPSRKSFLHINVTLSEAEAEILISDNGIGISQKYIQSIFDMFFRATERSDGSGLGLYIVKQTVEKLHGYILVDSKPGKGTTFKIHLPNQHLTGLSEIALDPQKQSDLRNTTTS